jgi:prepilin-type N-terminal cleavage/methylation domain-containing protein
MNGQMKHTRRGLTLVELLVGLMVGSIILGAVATLAYAMNAANRSSEEISRTQAEVRYATLRISELIRYAKLVASGGDNDLAIWRADDNGDNQINPSELVYIEAGAGRNYIKLLDFPSAPDANVPLSSLKDGSAKSSLVGSYGRRIEMVPQCSNVVFYRATIDENSSSVGVGFDVREGSAQRHYEIIASLRCRADNLLDGSGIVTNDDD